MAFQNQKKPTEVRTGINPVTAVVVGAAIAAGAAVAGAVAMNDKRNRNKVNKALDVAKKRADEKIHRGKAEVKKVVDRVLE